MQTNKVIVVKIGTKVIASKEKGLDRERVRHIVEQVSRIQDKHLARVVLVTSGAICSGAELLALNRPRAKLAELQAAASVGQSYLMHLYGEYFKERGYLVGQILLTQEDFDDRRRYLNIKLTIDALLKNKAVPIINENDTVSTDEIRCGDNDRIAGLVADLCGADKLILLTDVDGLLDDEGLVIAAVDEITPRIMKLVRSSKCELGTGGMATKIEAAGRVTHAGIECVVANGRTKGILMRIMKGEGAGTTFKSSNVKFMAKKRWIAYSSKPKGVISIDAGAREALIHKGKSLLASGVVSVKGTFAAGDAVSVIDKDGRECARGLVNYSSSDVTKIKGARSSHFKEILGYKGRDEVIHKDNLAIL